MSEREKKREDSITGFLVSDKNFEFLYRRFYFAQQTRARSSSSFVVSRFFSFSFFSFSAILRAAVERKYERKMRRKEKKEEIAARGKEERRGKNW